MGLHCHIPGCCQNPSLNGTSMFPPHREQDHQTQSCGHHMSNMQPHTWQATLSLGLGFGGSNLHSIVSILQAYASLISPQPLCLYLPLRPTVCTPVSCSCLHLLPPLVDGCQSFIYLLALCPDSICVHVMLW